MPFILSILLVYLFSFQVQDKPDRTWTNHLEEELINTIAQNDLSRGVYSNVVTKLRMKGIPAGFVFRTFSDPGIRIESEVENRFNHPLEKLPYD